MTQALLGIDLGASGLKATIVCPDGGDVLGASSHPISTQRPQANWSEQNPFDWYHALCIAVPKALAKSKLDSSAVKGIAISAGAHIPVLLDKNDKIIRPAIMWNDQRSATQALALEEQHGDLIIGKSLNRVNPTWSLAMLHWLQQHEPENIARVHKLCMAKDYLRLCLTGEWATDFGDVIGALMGDIETRAWSEEVSKSIDWPVDTLPPVKSATDVSGEISTEVAGDTGLKTGTPVMVGSIDTTVELLGAGVMDEGQAAIKLATAGVLSLVANEPVLKPPISCYPHLQNDRYYVAAGTNSCASAHQWARDQLVFPKGITNDGTLVDGFKAMDDLAAKVAPGSDGLIFHPYLQGERAPYWDPDLRADFLGLTMQHTSAHIARAVYEGIAYSIRDLLHDAGEKDFHFNSARLIGGGASSVTWRQITADVTGLMLHIPTHGDASFGSALLAGIGIGEFTDAADAINRCVKIIDQVKPDPGTRSIYDTMFDLYRRAQQVLVPINHELAELNRQNELGNKT